MGPAFGRIAAAVEAVSHAKAPSAFSLPFPEAVVSVKQCFVHCSIPLVPSYHHPQQGYATPKILQPTLPVQLNFGEKVTARHWGGLAANQSQISTIQSSRPGEALALVAACLMWISHVVG